MIILLKKKYLEFKKIDISLSNDNRMWICNNFFWIFFVGVIERNCLIEEYFGYGEE